MPPLVWQEVANSACVQYYVFKFVFGLSTSPLPPLERTIAQQKSVTVLYTRSRWEAYGMSLHM